MVLRSCDLWPLGRHARSIRNKASGLEGNDLRPLGKRDMNFRNKVEHGTFGAAFSGEVKTCREGDVVEAGAEAILNNLCPTSLFIYALGLEE